MPSLHRSQERACGTLGKRIARNLRLQDADSSLDLSERSASSTAASPQRRRRGIQLAHPACLPQAGKGWVKSARQCQPLAVDFPRVFGFC